MTPRPGYNWGNFVRVIMLGLWLIAFAWLLSGRRYQQFLQPRLWPLFVGAIVLLLLFFGAAYFRMGRPASHGARLRERIGQAALLLLPLIYMGAGASGGGLGGDAYRRRALAGPTGASLGPAGPRQARTYSAEGVNDVTLLQIVNDRGALAGKQVAAIGRLYRLDTMPPGDFVLYRFVVVCCAADAIPVGITCHDERIERWPADTWLRVTGRVETRTLDGEPAAYIPAERTESVEAPTNPYLSPF